MTRPKKPEAVFEVIFTGGGVYPEKIPIGKVSDALSAIRRLTAGEVVGDEDEGDDEGDGSIRLLQVNRKSSAVFQFVSGTQKLAVHRLKETGRILENPDDVGESEYILRPIKDLSSIAGALGCNVVLREAGKGGEVLARIGPESYARISHSILVSGNTQIAGKVERVGGATAMRCALRVSFQNKLLFCKIESDSVAKKLGNALYQRVVVHGAVRWLKNSMRIFSFTVQDVTETKTGSISDHLKALWEAGLQDWGKIEDPDTYLQEARGDE
ncbi:MAG TPA: hypothetical protein DDY78_07620 [Planctomycetales bacterium]|jgi:hypothetical protein|nr:hypothetical protein [Planctomycetales bacterium]